MADTTATDNADEPVTTTQDDSETSNPPQDGGVEDSQTERFDDHKWESDEEWQLLLRGLDFGVMPEDRKQKYIEKRKHKYFKAKIDPSHEIPKVETSSRGARYQAPPQSTPTTDNNDNTDDSNTKNDNDNGNDNDDNNDNSDNTKDESKKEEEKPKPKPKPKPTTSSGSSSSNRSSYRRSQPQLTRQQELMNYFFVLSQWFILINCVLSVVMPSSHYRALYGVIVSHIVALIQNTGRPRFDMYYAQTLFQDENVMIAIYGLMFLMGPPVFVFLIPVAMRSLSMGCYMLSAVLSQKAPAIHSKVHPLLVKVTSKYYFFVRNIALAEVLMGIFLIPACFFISKTVILTLFYWQIMHARYMMSAPIKQAFTIVNTKIESMLAPVPAALNIYRKIAGFLYDKVDPVKLQEQMRQQQQGGGVGGGLSSMMQKCNIM